MMDILDVILLLLLLLLLVVVIAVVPITVAARSKALIVFTRSNAGNVGSNPFEV
jgi:hypothetical protein